MGIFGRGKKPIASWWIAPFFCGFNFQEELMKVKEGDSVTNILELDGLEKPINDVYTP